MSRGLELGGRVAIVTGAAQGLGRAEATALAARGARVVAVDVRDPAEAVAEITAAGGTATAAVADLRDPGAGERVVEVARERFGGLDIVVNNAGMVRDRMSFNLSDEDWQSVIDVNLSGAFYVARAAARAWREEGGGPANRALVNTCSESGLYANAGQANYAAAKAGLAALTLTLAAELDRLGVRVNAIAPRARTPMSLGAFGELPRRAGFDPFAPAHVAGVVTWLVSEAAADVTGQVLVVHGGGVELMRPWSVKRSLARSAGWTDEELLALRERLFPQADWRHIPEPIGELFVTQMSEEG